MDCASALSTARDTGLAFREVLGRVADGLGGEPADLALAFVSADHGDSLGRLATDVRARGLGRHVLGCTGESIVGEDREVEASAALSLWALRLPGIVLRPRRLAFTEDVPNTTSHHGALTANPRSSSSKWCRMWSSRRRFPTRLFGRAW